MKILMINASPKKQNSSSGVLLSDFKTCFPENTDFTEIKLSSQNITNKTSITKEDEIISCINAADVLVVSFPLYVDALPANLLYCLCQIQACGINNQGLKVYGIANCGFHEGAQNAIALQILENWCESIGVTWGQGIGVGGGGGFAEMGSVPLGKGPKKSMGIAFQTMAKNIQQGALAENIFISIDLPRFIYKMAAEFGWRNQVKGNGLSVKDMARRL